MSTATASDAYLAGKAQPQRYKDAVRIMRVASLRKRDGHPVDSRVIMLCWGTIMAAAQQVDPSVRHRHAAIVALGIKRQDLFG